MDAGEGVKTVELVVGHEEVNVGEGVVTVALAGGPDTEHIRCVLGVN